MTCDGKKSGIKNIVIEKPGGENFTWKNVLAKSLMAKILHKKTCSKK